jgi:hypothetical protein
MLENFMLPQTVAEADGLIFQRDGAPAHVGAIARSALDERFRGRWIGRGGPINWPPRNPELTPTDFFFFWRYNKDVVHSERVPKDCSDYCCDACGCALSGVGVKWNLEEYHLLGYDVV